MDERVRVPEECGSRERNSNSPVHEVTYKELDLNNTNELMHLLGLFWEFWLKANGEDLSDEEDYILDGETKRMMRIEPTFWYFMHKEFDVQLAYLGEEMIGFLMYKLVFNCVAIVPCIYIEQKYFGKGIGKALMDSLKHPVKLILFQTRKSIPPGQFLKSASHHFVKVNEGPEFITWKMKWGES